VAQIQRVTGMQDVLPEDRKYWDAIERTFISLAGTYGFQRIDLPILEYSELFSRGVGEGSDFFVQKEMYSISDEGSSSLTLRPEITAGMVRAYLQNGMQNWSQPVKLFTMGPLFRRERPQAGRFRQHSQCNPEIIGESDPAADAEIMSLTATLFRRLGYKELKFQVNSTGCGECRPAYLRRLRQFFNQHQERLSELDLERLRRNPLRIFDSKEPGIEELQDEAPHSLDHICQDCSDHFQDLLKLLDALGESYEINFRLVRGIDYYTKTVFELWDASIGAQSALCGGGRYDGLAEAIGGPSAPGVGVGIGIERIVLGMKQQGIEVPEADLPELMFIHFGGESKVAAVQLAAQLRHAGIGARVTFSRTRRSMKSQMREAGRHNARWVIIIGDDELAQGKVTVKLMDGGQQHSVDRESLAEWFAEPRS